MKSLFGVSHNAKIALIPVLAGILYLVLPKSSTKDKAGAATPTKVATESHRHKRTIRPPNPEAHAKEPIVWPEIRLEDLSGADPFDRRRMFPEQAIDPASATDIEKETFVSLNGEAGENASPFKTIAIQAIYESPQGVIAIIDGRMIHVGDRLEDGREVVGIYSDHIQVTTQSID